MLSIGFSKQLQDSADEPSVTSSSDVSSSAQSRHDLVKILRQLLIAVCIFFLTVVVEVGLDASV